MQPFSAALREIAGIPGARYSCVADDVTGDVLAEHGRPGVDPAAAVRWGCGLRAALQHSGELEDVMITAEGTYHLLRRVRDGSRTLLVHVSVDRADGNLALARRTLGAIRLADLSPAPEPVEPPRSEPVEARPSAARVPDQRAPAALPVRTPARPARAPGASLSAVPPPRRPITPETITQIRAEPATAAPASGAVGPAPPIAVPEARGWSDDLHTMRRLLDALRRM